MSMRIFVKMIPLNVMLFWLGYANSVEALANPLRALALTLVACVAYTALIYAIEKVIARTWSPTMIVLNIVWPGFTAARRIAASPVRFLVAGLEACMDFPSEVAPRFFRWIAGLVMFFLVFIFGIAALIWPAAMVVIGWAAHTEMLSISHAQNWAVWLTLFAYGALVSSKVMK
jgi:hypothetical protein